MEIIFKSATLYLAFVFCAKVLSNSERKHLALILLPCPDTVGSDPQIYHCTYIGGDYTMPRLVAVGEDIIVSTPWPRTWTTLHISAKPPFRADAALPRRLNDWSLHRTLRFTNVTNTVPFRIPPEAQAVAGLVCSGVSSTIARIRNDGWAGTPPLTLFYALAGLEGAPSVLAVCLGLCNDSSGTHHWAHTHCMLPRDGAGAIREDGNCESHVCARDHISTWHEGTRIFDESWPKVALMFTVCRLNETGNTLVMHLWCV